jgi:hypothetical protein
MLNEERVKLFATLLEVLTAGSPVVEKLKESGQSLDCYTLVCLIAETVPYPSNPMWNQPTYAALAAPSNNPYSYPSAPPLTSDQFNTCDYGRLGRGGL